MASIIPFTQAGSTYSLLLVSFIFASFTTHQWDSGLLFIAKHHQ